MTLHISIPRVEKFFKLECSEYISWTLQLRRFIFEVFGNKSFTNFQSAIVEWGILKINLYL